MASESISFDVFLRDAASAGFLRLGQSAANAADNVAQVGRRMDYINGRIATARVDLAGDKAALLQLDRLQFRLAQLAKTTANPDVTVEGLARTLLGLSSVDVAIDKLNASAAAGAAPVARLGGGFGVLGVVGALAGRQVSLFGGALKGVPFLAAVSGLHLAIDGLIEFAGVVLPASIAVTAFGAAAIPTLQDIGTLLKNIQTVSTATGRAMPPLTGGFAKLAAAARPEVMVLFGEALDIVSRRTGTLTTLVTGAGQVLDQLGARFTVAVTSGKGFGGFLANADSDLSQLGDIAGNLGGVLGNVFKAVPGYAQVLLTLADDASKAAEALSALAVHPLPLLHTSLLGMTLAAHGAFLYIGLLATAAARVVPGALNALGRASVNVGGFLEKFGTAGERAAGGILNLGVQAEGAAALPWGWIAGAAIGLGILIDKLVTARDATQLWFGSLQKALGATNAVKGFVTSQYDLVQVTSRLADAQNQVTKSTQNVTAASLALGRGGYGQVATAAGNYAQQITELQGDYRILIAGQNLYQYRLQLLGKQFGGTQAAQGLLIASGVTWNELMNKTKTGLAQVEAQVKAVQSSYYVMHQRGTVLTADMGVLNHLASDQYTAMKNLNSAWATYIGDLTGLLGNAQAIEQAMTTVTTDAKKQAASFTGGSQASIQLQADTASLVNAIQTEINSMRQAGDSGKQLRDVLKFALTPAVKDGALQNDVLRTAIFKMAQEAGYHGVNSVAALKAWFDRAKVSAHDFAGAVDRVGGSAAATTGKVNSLAQAMARLHSVNAQIKVSGTGTYSIVQSSPVQGPHAAAGLMVTGGTPGRDSVPVLAQRGELIVPVPMVKAGAVDHLRGKIPGFAAGGVAGSYAGPVAGLPPWVGREGAATVTAMEKAVASAVVSGIRSARQSFTGGFPGAGTPGGGSAAANYALAQRLFPWPASMFPAFNDVEMREAGYSLTAQNPSSGAYGMAQFINGPGEYYQYGGNPNTAAGQLIAMFNYIKQRYGTPVAAWAHEVGYGWYGDGLDAVFRKPTLIGVGERGPERVQVTPRGGGGGDIHVHLHIAPGAVVTGNPREIGKHLADYLNVAATGGTRLRKSILAASG